MAWLINVIADPGSTAVLRPQESFCNAGVCTVPAYCQPNCVWACGIGKWSTHSMGDCYDCPAGRYQGDGHAIGVDSCLTCDAGKQVNGPWREARFGAHIAPRHISSGCVACPAGKVSTAGDPDGCLDCAVGRRHVSAGDDPSTPDVVEGDDPSTPDDVEANHLWGGFCMACPAGQVAPAPGAVACLPCAAGRYDDLAADVCALCEDGAFSHRQLSH